eukprot:9207673-Pyramimonas_sp.AAC.1
MMKEIWLTISVPLLQRTTGAAGMGPSRSRDMIPTRVKSSWAWGAAMCKAYAATRDVRHMSKLSSLEKLAWITQRCGPC